MNKRNLLLVVFVICIISMPALAWKPPSGYKGKYGQTWTDERIKPPKAPITHQDYAGMPLGYTPIQPPLLPPPNAGTILPPPTPALALASTPVPVLAPAPAPTTPNPTTPGQTKPPHIPPKNKKIKIAPLSLHVSPNRMSSTDTAIAQ